MHKIFLALFLILFVGCKSVPTDVNSLSKFSSKDEVLISHTIKRLPASNFLFKRSNFSIESESINQGLSGSLFIQTDSFIIVSLQALLGIEVARIKIMPKEVIVIDRFNKQVTYLNYNTFIDKYAKGLSFSVLQSLLLNSTFDLSSSNVNLINGSSFSSTFDDTQLLIDNQPSSMFSWLRSSKVSTYHQGFVFDTVNGNLVQTYINEQNLNTSLRVDYSTFTSTGGCSLPLNSIFLATVKEKSYKISFSSNSFVPNSDSGISFSIPSSYDKIKK